MSTKATHTLLCAAALLLAGCAEDAALRSHLDDRGRTWLTVDAPVALARPAPRFSRAARDYLYLAPVEANNAGVRRHYLWVGLGTTVDRRWPWAAPPTASTLLLTLDGVRLALSLDEWQELAGAALYRTLAPVYDVRRASVSLDQLERIAAATAVEALVVAQDGGVTEYDLWSGQWSDWAAFVAGTDVASVDRPLRARR